MKKYILITALLIFTIISYNCSNDESREDVNFAALSDSKLKALMLQQEMQNRKLEIDSPGGPQDCRMSTLTQFSSITTTVKDEILDSFSTFYDIKDNDLDGTTTGEIYIEAYYLIGGIISSDAVTWDEIYNFLAVLPTVYDIKSRMDDSLFTGTVISTSDGEKLIELVKYYQTKQTTNSNYQDMLDAIIDDIESVTNKNSTQVKAFLNS